MFCYRGAGEHLCAPGDDVPAIVFPRYLTGARVTRKRNANGSDATNERFGAHLCKHGGAFLNGGGRRAAFPALRRPTTPPRSAPGDSRVKVIRDRRPLMPPWYLDARARRS
ncbi:unnamed protein product, partial [Iphiclides podalirius]